MSLPGQVNDAATDVVEDEKKILVPPRTLRLQTSEQAQIPMFTSRDELANGGSMPSNMVGDPKANEIDTVKVLPPTSLDVAKAHRYVDLTHPRKKNKDGTYSQYDYWDFEESTFRRYGLGLYLYFQYIRKMGWLMLFFSLITIPSMVFFADGPGTTTEDSFFIQVTMMGNLGNSNTTEVLGTSKKDIGASISGVDVFGVLVMLVFYYVLKKAHSKARVEYNRSVMTVVRFSVQVTDVPPDCYDRQKVQQHFRRFGSVVDVAIAYNDGALVDAYSRRGALRKELVAEKARIRERLRLRIHKQKRKELEQKWKDAEKRKIHISEQQKQQETQAMAEREEVVLQEQLTEAENSSKRLGSLIDRLEKIDAELSELEDGYEKQAVAYFVTFERQEAVDECLSAYPRAWYLRWCMREELRFEGYKINVTRAPEPSNILFVNLATTATDRCQRRSLSNLITFLVIGISMAIVYIAQFYQNQIPIDSECFTEYTRADAVIAEAAGNSNIVDCYCNNLGADVVNERPLCDDWITAFALSRTLILVTAFSIVLVNYLLKEITSILGRYEKHMSLTHEQQSVTTKLFVGLFLNTGFILLLVNADLESTLGNIGVEVLFNGQYEEFVPDWYNVVGNSIFFTMFVNMVNPHLLPVVLLPFRRCSQRSAATEAATQAELNAALTGGDFELSERYAVALNTLFVTLFYSAGLPVLYALAFFTYFLTYFLDKYSFLRWYKIPPRFDDNLAEFAASMLPYAVAVHCLISVWFYSSPSILSYSLKQSDVSGTINEVPGDLFNIKSRILLWNVFPMFLLLLLMITYRLVSDILWLLVGAPLSALAECCCTTKVDDELKMTYSEARAKVRLESYHLWAQRDYLDAFLVTESHRQLIKDPDLPMTARRVAMEKAQEQAAERNEQTQETAILTTSEEPHKQDSANIPGQTMSSDSLAQPKILRAPSHLEWQKNAAEQASGRSIGFHDSLSVEDLDAGDNGKTPTLMRQRSSQEQIDTITQNMRLTAQNPAASAVLPSSVSSNLLANQKQQEPSLDAVVEEEEDLSDIDDDADVDTRPENLKVVAIPVLDMPQMTDSEQAFSPRRPTSSGGAHNRRVSKLAQEWGVKVPRRSSRQVVTGTELMLSCPVCTHDFKIVDVGEAAEYACPFCDNRFQA